MVEVNKIYFGDCFDHLVNIEDESVDLILVDPPYGTIKGLDINKNRKNVYRTDWDTVLDMESLFSEYFRVLKRYGKLIIFSQGKFTMQVRNLSDSRLQYIYPLVWHKNDFANHLSVNKAPVSYFEDISVFKKLYGSQPKARAYAKKIIDFINLPVSYINKELGHGGASHFLHVNGVQFSKPTEKTYNELQVKFQIDKMDDYLQYKDFLDLYNSELSGNTSVFNIPKGKGHFSNVLSFKKDYPSLHPTMKPLSLLEELIKVYTNEGSVVLDSCMGSGSTCVAALNTNRNYIGIEKDLEYYKVAEQRLKDAHDAYKVSK